MSDYYKDYQWRNGIPYGTGKINTPSGISYKIPMDPYRKRITIEEYDGSAFKRIIYDSALLDFRHLRPNEQTAWQKTEISTSPEKVISLIRNQDDRLICVETCLFAKGLCVECRLLSPHGVPLSVHRMFYTSLGADFNGVILYDTNHHAVMKKKYGVDEAYGDFTDLIEESWECSDQLQGV